MDSFFNTCAIVLLLFLKREFSSGHRPPARYTSIFKTPWIEFKNGRQNGNGSHCKNDVATVYASADSGEKWALRMLDASSKLPSGVLLGNILDLGTYDECIGVKSHNNPAHIQAQHCMVSLSIPSKYVEDAATMLFIQKMSLYNPTAGINPSLTLSVCLPSSCVLEDIVELVNGSVRTMSELAAFDVNVVGVKCSSVEPEDTRTLGKILTLSLFGTVATFLLLCTVCDFAVRKSSANLSLQSTKVFAKFSLYTNAMRLLSTKATDDTMPAINGLRFISTCLVLVGHRLVLGVFRPLVNPSDILAWMGTVSSAIALSSPRIVDTFFVLSGFLATYKLLTALRSGKEITLPMLYIHRYLRLTPCMIVFLLFGVFMFPELGSGPMWETVVSAARDHCRKNWWTNLLYINNLVNRQEMCMPTTWYLAVEMQLFWLFPVTVLPLHYKPKLGLTLLGLLSMVSLIIPSAQLAINRWTGLLNLRENNLQTACEHLADSYPMTHNRALPYLIGILLGYDVAKKKRQFTKFQVLFNWTLTCVTFLLCSWANYFAQPISPRYNVVGEVAQVSVVRLAWSIAIVWIIYACTQGHGGIVADFLSLPVFLPLSRLCYCIYLIHPFLQLWTHVTHRTSVFFSPLADIYPIGSDLLLSVGAAFVLNLCVESPITVLEKHFMEKRWSTVEQRGSAQEVDKLNIIEHRTIRNPIFTDPVYEERRSRIIAELAKIWQEWKSHVAENDEMWDIREEVTGLTKAEQAFLTLFTTTIRSTDKNAGRLELEIPEAAISELESCELRDENSSELSTSRTTSSSIKKTE